MFNLAYLLTHTTDSCNGLPDRFVTFQSMEGLFGTTKRYPKPHLFTPKPAETD